MNLHMANGWMVLAALVCTGCATAPAYEREFGASVRSMITSQTYNPRAGLDAQDQEVPTADGAKTEMVLREYRKDVAKPKDVTKDMQINVGN